MQPAGPVVRVGSGEYEVARGELESLRRDVHKLLGQIRLIPVEAGFQVRQLRPGSIFARLGLESGDVLTAVNGQSLSAPGDLIGLYGQLGTIEELALDLRRRDEPRTLRYRIVE